MLKRSLLILLIFLFIFPCIASSKKPETVLFSPSGDPKVPVFVFRSQKALDEATKFIASGRSPLANYGVFHQYVRAIAESGTPCLVLDSTFATKKIRILDGPHKGKVGWVPTEMVR
jgi:hypothetical protein